MFSLSLPAAAACAVPLRFSNEAALLSAQLQKYPKRSLFKSSFGTVSPNRHVTLDQSANWTSFQVLAAAAFSEPRQPFLPGSLRAFIAQLAEGQGTLGLCEFIIFEAAFVVHGVLKRLNNVVPK